MTASPGVPLLSDQSAPMRALISRGIAPSNLYRALANQPSLLHAWTDFAWRLRADCVTPRALRELLILRAALVGRAPYVWQDHVAMALQAGVPETKIAALRDWPAASCFAADERTALGFADQLLRDVAVDDNAQAALAAHFDPAERVELGLTIAFYAMAPRALAALAVPLRPAVGAPPEVAVPYVALDHTPR